MDMEISSAQQQAMARSNTQLMMESDQKQRRILGRPQPDQALKCPRCDSTNTKFCYYNNYSLSQPRYFCKGCRRYWTQGGSLRNVPVGGGCRKNNKRSTSSSSFKKPHDQALITPDTTIMNPLLPNVPLPFSHNPSDLTLALNRLQNPNDFLLRPPLNLYPNPNTTGFLDILKSGFLDSTNYPSTSGLGNNACSSYNGTFDMGLSSASTSTTASETVQGQFENNDTDVSHGVGVNSSRDYWNGAANTYWHGLMNSSLM